MQGGFSIDVGERSPAVGFAVSARGVDVSCVAKRFGWRGSGLRF